ncbi:YegP family protein [Aeromonas sp. MR7]|uniref:YegP family protein n=1 Tax=Aeromonas TaxID=642 RepID=UPI001F4B6AAE|nr:YegP family protein [Aeromonas sp. MR7]MCH7347317.1 YegP family protein [Aeromonas sp. MR7]
MGYYVIHKSKKTTDQPFYFVLHATNGEPIATSEMYTTKEGAKNGIKSVQNNGSTTDIRDKTDV